MLKLGAALQARPHQFCEAEMEAKALAPGIEFCARHGGEDAVFHL